MPVRTEPSRGPNPDRGPPFGEALAEVVCTYQNLVCVCCSQGAAEAIQTQQDLPGGERHWRAVVRAAGR